MSHNFYFDTCKFIDKRVETIKQVLVESTADDMGGQYAAGRIDALCEIERFLDRHIRPKLPNRLRRTISQRNRTCTVDDRLPSGPQNDNQ